MNETLKKEAEELIPKELNVEVLSISGVVYDYYDHKYAEGGAIHENACICVTIKDEAIKKPLHIHFFNGANYRHTDVQYFIACNEDLITKDSIKHEHGSFSKDDNFELEDEDENARYTQIIETITVHCEGDDEIQGALSEFSILNRAEHIQGLKNIVIYMSISLDDPDKKEIEELEGKLKEAKEALLLKKKSDISKFDKCDLKGKNLNTISAIYSSDDDDETLEQSLRDQISNFDLTVCDSCHDIHDSCDEVRYQGHDYVFTDKRANDENLDGFILCDDCLECDKNNIELI